MATPIVAVFPGQGSQHVGMAKDLYENFSIVKQTFEEASDAIRLDIKKLCFDGPESDLVLTENTQPCLLAASVAAFRVAEKEHGFVPVAAAGHSLGEYSALVAAGSLDLGVAVRWVRSRGMAMQKAVPAGEGTMAAILGLENQVVEKLCARATEVAQEKRKQTQTDAQVAATVEPANFNSPGQVVIAGSTDAVQEAIGLAKQGGDFAGAKAIPLQVSAPFHCSLMRPARDQMAEIFSSLPLNEKPKTPLFPYVPNRTARVSREAALVLELLVEQIDHPVLWNQSVQGILENGWTTFVEFGPGKVLTGLVKRIASASGKTCTLASVNDTASIKTLTNLINS